MTSVRRMLRNPIYVVLLVVLTWIIIAFLLVPNINVLTSVFFQDGQFSLRSVERLLGSDRAVRALWNSFVLAVVLSVTVNVVGVFIVLVTRYFDIRGGRFLWFGFATTLLYGGIVLVSGYKMIYGSNGFITNLLLNWFPGMDPAWFSGMLAVVLVSTFAATGNHLLFMSAAISKVDFQTIEAAKMMGANAWKVLRTVVLPTLKPMFFAITILTFLGGLGALAAPQVLGGNDFQTITPMILSVANSPSSRDLAATLAIILALATVVLLVVLNRLEAGGTYFSVSKVPVALEKQKISNPVANAIVHALAYLLFVIYMIPPILITVFSFTDARAINTGEIRADSFTLENYAHVLGSADGFRPFLVSIVYGAVTALVVIVLMLFTARMVQQFPNRLTRAIEYLLHIPWILPGTMVALGLIITYDHPNALVGGQVLTGTLVILLIAYIAGKIPFTFRLLKAAFAGVPANLEEAASMLGAGPLYIFRRVILPLVIPTAAAITALNFNSLLDDYDQAVFLAHPLYPPLGIFIRDATSGETINDATALTFVYTVLLMILTGLTLWLVYGRGAGKDRPGADRPGPAGRLARLFRKNQADQPDLAAASGSSAVTASAATTQREALMPPGTTRR